MADTTLADHMADDLADLILTANAAGNALDRGDMTPAALRSAVHTMRSILNRVEGRLDRDLGERVRLARIPGSGHGNTGPPAP